jgi:hypothetical protein
MILNCVFGRRRKPGADAHQGRFKGIYRDGCRFDVSILMPTFYATVFIKGFQNDNLRRARATSHTLERFRRVIITAQHCAANIAYWRAARSLASEPTAPKHRDVRTRTANNFLDVGVLEWCKLFVDSERHAWRRVIPADKREEFFVGMLTAVGKTAAEWDAYIDPFKLYRDKFIAHLDSERTMCPPVLDAALEALIFYMDYLKDHDPLAANITPEQFDIRSFYEKLRTDSLDYL